MEEEVETTRERACSERYAMPGRVIELAPIG